MVVINLGGWMDELADRLDGLDEPSMKKYNQRAERLRKEGYREDEVGILAAGIPPKDILHWPANLRYDLSKLERAGMDRPSGIKEIRRKLDSWWFNTHNYKQ